MGKKKHEEHENHERWLVSYADFITLLFAFFVVMYSVSSVNEGKFRVLSSSMFQSFSNAPKVISPVKVGDNSPSGKTPTPQGSQTSTPTLDMQNYLATPVNAPTSNRKMGVGGYSTGSGKGPEFADPMRKVAADLKKALGTLVEEGRIKVNHNDRGVVVDINANVLFLSGQAALTPEALPVMEQIATVLATMPNDIQVEGFTDDQPINTPAFPTNWELSTARATSVVRVLASRHIEPTRLVAAGFGEYHPVAPNDTAEGRSRNRRVSIALLAPNRRATIGGSPIISRPDALLPVVKENSGVSANVNSAEGFKIKMD